MTVATKRSQTVIDIADAAWDNGWAVKITEQFDIPTIRAEKRGLVIRVHFTGRGISWAEAFNADDQRPVRAFTDSFDDVWLVNVNVKQRVIDALAR